MPIFTAFLKKMSNVVFSYFTHLIDKLYRIKWFETFPWVHYHYIYIYIYVYIYIIYIYMHIRP